MSDGVPTLTISVCCEMLKSASHVAQGLLELAYLMSMSICNSVWPSILLSHDSIICCCLGLQHGKLPAGHQHRCLCTESGVSVQGFVREASRTIVVEGKTPAEVLDKLAAYRVNLCQLSTLCISNDKQNDIWVRCITSVWSHRHVLPHSTILSHRTNRMLHKVL